RLAAQLDLLEKTERSWSGARGEGGVLVATRIRSFKSDGTPPREGMARYVSWVNQLLTPEDHRRERYIEAPVAHSSVLGRREVFERGYRDLSFCEDYDLWLHLLERGARFAKTPEVLLSVRDDADRISRNDRRYSQGALRACKLEHLLGAPGPLSSRREVLIWGAGRVGKRWLRELPELGVRVPAAVDLHPRKLGRKIHGARVVPPEALRQEWDALRDPFILVAVGAPGARDEIRAWLSAASFVEERDYLMVA
ncbi:MAG: glycosyl transferase, partial [Polyangia bacterium]|nr:glycosyl transferase [Polyangia bacterium]